MPCDAAVWAEREADKVMGKRSLASLVPDWGGQDGAIRFLADQVADPDLAFFFRQVKLPGIDALDRLPARLQSDLRAWVRQNIVAFAMVSRRCRARTRWISWCGTLHAGTSVTR
jgi:hypothetical protein